ncbi:MAG: hypothetical protein WB567_15245, partial [Terracidiphilus sp.]
YQGTSLLVPWSVRWQIVSGSNRQVALPRAETTPSDNAAPLGCPHRIWLYYNKLPEPDTTVLDTMPDTSL